MSIKKTASLLLIAFFIHFYSYSQDSTHIIVDRYINKIDKNKSLKNITCISESGIHLSNIAAFSQTNPIKQFKTYRKINGIRKSEVKSKNSVTIICFDGEKEVLTNNGKPIILPPLQIKNSKYDTTFTYNSNKPPHEFFINYLVDSYLKNEISDFSFLGQEVIEGEKECYVLKANKYIDKKNIYYYYLDVTNCLPLLEKRIDTISGYITETYFENYKESGNILFPFDLKIHTYLPTNEQFKMYLEVRYNEIIINPKIDDSIFDCSKPNKIIIKE